MGILHARAWVSPRKKEEDGKKEKMKKDILYINGEKRRKKRGEK
jgi:hypothetical protein